MPTQTETGKAFEYALITQASNILSGNNFTVNVVQDATYNITLACYNIFNAATQLRYSQAAAAAINHIVTLEPRLLNTNGNNDNLTLRLQPDAVGIAGDVRDLLFIRSAQNWEIGISAKNNHKALKHSRLSGVLDFGNSWFNIPCSNNYFTDIAPIFLNLTALKAQGALWRNMANKHTTVYVPLLDAFRTELLAINNANANIPSTLALYLIGQNDFYKVIKRRNVVEVLAFNLAGTLGRRIGAHSPASPVRRLALPTQIVQFQMAANSTDTLSMVCNNGWQFSFRIHNASSLVEPSLKFDINLVGNPHNIYTHNAPY